MKIQLLLSDITTVTCDAIVNAANNSLMGGGGVDGAIHFKGGPAILEACKVIVQRQGGCATGQAVYTGAGKLPAKYVIHTVGPVWHGGNQNEAALLQSCYRQSLLLANELGATTIAFPNISTGVYNYPKSQAAQIALQTVRNFEAENHTLETIFFVCYDVENYEIYRPLLA